MKNIYFIFKKSKKSGISRIQRKTLLFFVEAWKNAIFSFFPPASLSRIHWGLSVQSLFFKKKLFRCQFDENPKFDPNFNTSSACSENQNSLKIRSIVSIQYLLWSNYFCYMYGVLACDEWGPSRWIISLRCHWIRPNRKGIHFNLCTGYSLLQ